MINDIENDQIHYFSVEAKKNIFGQNDVSTLKDQSSSALLNTLSPNMQFRSQKLKLKFDRKLMLVLSIVIRGLIGSENGIDIFAQSTCGP